MKFSSFLKSAGAWTFGIFMLFGGLGLIGTSLLASVAAIALAALVLPPSSKALFPKFDTKSKTILGFISFFVLVWQVQVNEPDVAKRIPDTTPVEEVSVQEDEISEEAVTLEQTKSVESSQVAPAVTPKETSTRSTNTPAPAATPANEPEPTYSNEPTPSQTPVYQEPAPVYTPPPSQPTYNSSYSCSVPKTCTQMSSCEEAYFYLNVCGDSARDGDHDGVPCESICP